MKLISWNIAGGIKYSEQKESAEYFSQEINKLSPDIICLQETHINDQRSFVKETFANFYPYISEYIISESHNDSTYNLGLSIISKYPIQNATLIKLPNPKLQRVLDTSEKIFSHDKAIQLVAISDINIANIQLLPLHVFKKTYMTELAFCEQIDILMLEKLKTPLIFCGDFNTACPDKLFPQTFNKLELKESLNGDATFVYRDENPDHIYYSKELTSTSSNIYKTQTDHYLCYAEIYRNP